MHTQRRPSTLTRHRGASSIEWAALLAVLAALFVGIAGLIGGQGGALGGDLATVVRCWVASFAGGGGCAAPAAVQPNTPGLPFVRLVPGMLLMGGTVAAIALAPRALRGLSLNALTLDSLGVSLPSLDDLLNFGTGILAAWTANNGWFLRPFLPRQFEAIDYQPGEPRAMTAGRLVGDVLSIAQGIFEFTQGAGIMMGGGLFCAAGALAGGVGEVVTCPVSAPAIVGGAAVAVHGGGVAISGVLDIGRIFMAAITGEGGGNGEGDGNQPSQPSNDQPEPPLRKPGEGTGVDAKWGDPKSTKAYGHSQSEHGAKRSPQQLTDRARTKGTDQGQWYNDQSIVEAEQRAPLEPGSYDIDMGRSVGRVYHPDGTITEGVTTVRVVRKPDGTIRTSFPIKK